MRYVINLLSLKKEEYEFLLEKVTDQMKNNSFRTADEIKYANNAISHYKEILKEIDHSIYKLKDV